MDKVLNLPFRDDVSKPNRDNAIDVYIGDTIERARRSGVTAIVQPGGSIRDQQVIDTCNKYDIAMAFCGIRLFHH